MWAQQFHLINLSCEIFQVANTASNTPNVKWLHEPSHTEQIGLN